MIHGAKCDFCNKPAVAVTGELNHLLVCENHRQKGQPVSDIVALAKFMFERQASTYLDDLAHAREMWETNEGVREFWIGEATAVIDFQMGARA